MTDSKDKILQMLVEHLAADWDFQIHDGEKATAFATFKECPGIQCVFILHDEEVFRRQIEEEQARFNDKNLVLDACRLANAEGLPLEEAQRLLVKARRQVVSARL